MRCSCLILLRVRYLSPNSSKAFAPRQPRRIIPPQPNRWVGGVGPNQEFAPLRAVAELGLGNSVETQAAKV